MEEMTMPDDLEIVDSAGNARRNGEERRAINGILGYLRSLGEDIDVRVKDAAQPQPRMTLQTSVMSPSMPSRAVQEDDGPTPGTVWDKYPDSAFVMVKQDRGWLSVRREEAGIQAMVAEDGAREGGESPT